MKRHWRILPLLFVAISCGGGRDAAVFGFLPENSAEANKAAFQQCLDEGGRIIVSRPGMYRVCGTMLIKANTNLSFAKGVIISREKPAEGKDPQPLLMNAGALDGSIDENISIKGLLLQCNGMGGNLEDTLVVGLRGELAFLGVKKLTIKNSQVLGYPDSNFGIQVCDFENILLENLHIEGIHDAIHLGAGRDFIIRNSQFRTDNDAVAMNALDFPRNSPRIGWIENGLIDNCVDLPDPDAAVIGYFARMTAGSFKEWEEGMPIQHQGDAVLHNGRIYRSNGLRAHGEMPSTVPPTHSSGTRKLADGHVWTMLQDKDITLAAGVRNILFRNIHLQRPRHLGFNLHFDHSDWNRSFYPGAENVTQSNITLEKIYIETNLPLLLQARTPVDHIRVRDSDIGRSLIRLNILGYPGLEYENTVIGFHNVNAEDIQKTVMAWFRPYEVIYNDK